MHAEQDPVEPVLQVETPDVVGHPNGICQGEHLVGLEVAVVEDQPLTDSVFARGFLFRDGLANAHHQLFGDVRLLVEVQDPVVVPER